jgi:predicted nuclease of restriction endonuclease-like RecB superfamily
MTDLNLQTKSETKQTETISCSPLMAALNKEAPYAAPLLDGLNDNQAKSTTASYRKQLKRIASHHYRLKTKQRLAQVIERISALETKNRALQNELEETHLETILLHAVMPLLEQCQKNKKHK